MATYSKCSFISRGRLRPSNGPKGILSGEKGRGDQDHDRSDGGDDGDRDDGDGRGDNGFNLKRTHDHDRGDGHPDDGDGSGDNG